MSGRVTGLHVHPIKSCRGIARAAARLERRGLAWDRRWMIVDPTGLFVTQREEPSLALVDVAHEDGAIEVRAPRMQPLSFPASIDGGDALDVTIWGTTVRALAHEAAGGWVTEYLGRPLRMVHMPDTTVRPLSPKHAREGDVVSFADGFPVLLATEESLADLSSRAGSPMAMARFRPNVVVTGFSAWAEDGWSRVRIGAATFRAPKGCDRCPITTIDPATGEMGKEPLRTLATFRRRDNKVWFAINLVPELADGETSELGVGDAVIPLA